jgi:protein-S-isoprenylcysteine O-methyltransferase Ste14
MLRLRTGSTWVQRLRVPLGFLFAAVFIIFSRPTTITILIGAIVAFCGLMVRAWASGHIRKNAVLGVSGPYAYTRNPLYLGSFLLGIGFTIASGRPILWMLFVGLFLGIYWPVMRLEESHLKKLFGEEYLRYAAQVPLFFPSLKSFKSDGVSSSFDSSLYMRYREYRAALGALLAIGILMVKAYVL